MPMVRCHSAATDRFDRQRDRRAPTSNTDAVPDDFALVRAMVATRTLGSPCGGIDALRSASVAKRRNIGPDVSLRLVAGPALYSAAMLAQQVIALQTELHRPKPL